MDARTRTEKLRAMAEQDASPREAEIARAKLAAGGAGDREPPRRPPASGSPWWPDGLWHVSTSTTTSTTTSGRGTTDSTFSFTVWSVR